MNSDKSLLSPKQNNLKEIGDTGRQKTAKDHNATTNVFLYVPYTFLLFKAKAFLRIFFPRKLLFRQGRSENVSFSQ